MSQGGACCSSTLVVALDSPNGDWAESVALRLSALPVWYKIGLELFVATGPMLISQFRAAGRPVFLDLKFHDIPNTVKGACRSAAALGVQMLTVHLDGGEAMAHAALEGVGQGQERPLLLGVTVLTSTSLTEGKARAEVVRKALAAKTWGLDGVVCSGLEVAAVKEACGREFLCLTPGIRFAGGGVDDQARVCTPTEAVAAGADFLVMGRPITKAEAPEAPAQKALDEMSSYSSR